MNQRIEKLAKQVGAVRSVSAIGRHDGVLFTETELEKFAQLIVKECASTVDTYGRWILYDKLAVKLKKDFGVEE